MSVINLNTIRDRAREAYQWIDKIRTFDPSQENNAIQAKNALESNIRSEFNQSFAQLLDVACYCAIRDYDYAAVHNKTDEAISRIADEIKEAEQIRGQIDEILVATQKAAAEEGVTQEARHFNSEAEVHRKSAGKWLCATVLVALIMIVLAFGSMFLHQWKSLGLTAETMPVAAQIIAGKVLMFAVLSFVLLLCGRNFTAHRHNYVVNKHRQNALQTYQALVEAASEESSKDVVLTHAAMSIFGPQQTGYQGRSQQSAPSAKSVIEMIPAAFHEKE